MTRSLPAIMERTGSPTRAVWQKRWYDTWKCRLGQIQLSLLLTSILLRKKMKTDVLHLLILIYWWCCQRHREVLGFFLLFADTLAKVIDEKSVKLFNFSAFHVFVHHLLCVVSPLLWRRAKSGKEINADQRLSVYSRNVIQGLFKA